jgi:hypothetical protein
MDEIALLRRGSINFARNQHRNEVFKDDCTGGSWAVVPGPLAACHSEALRPRQRRDSFPREQIEFPF